MKIFNTIRKLTEADIEETARFYAESAKYVDYFQKMFGKQDVAEDVYVNFKPDVAAAIRTGLCLGIFEKGNMIGCVLSIDWHLYKQEHPTLFDHMFLPELDTTKQIEDYVGKLDGPCFFIYAVLVAETMRCQGVASNLLKKYSKLLSHKCYVVSDCTYEYANSMWLKNGYKLEQLSNELTLVMKEM